MRHVCPKKTKFNRKNDFHTSLTSLFLALVPIAVFSEISFAAECPTGYIAVPKNPTYTTADFCIAKYEAKNSSGTIKGSGTALSQLKGQPWTTTSTNQQIKMNAARAACQANGSRYDLIGDSE